MMIPIHAFPKMNIHMKEYLPKYIDFGNVSIDTAEQKIIYLKNIIDTAFEYEFVPTKQCEQISITPCYDSINPVSNEVIKIKFLPKSYGFFQAEYEFRLSEMDYVPLKVTISGSCNVYDKVIDENIVKYTRRVMDTSQGINASSILEDKSGVSVFYLIFNAY